MSNDAKKWTVDELCREYRASTGEEPSAEARAQYEAYVANPTGDPPTVTADDSAMRVSLTLKAFAQEIQRRAEPKPTVTSPEAQEGPPAPPTKPWEPSKYGRPGTATGGFGIVGGSLSPPKSSIRPSIEQALHHRKVMEQLNDELPDAFRRDNGWVDRDKH